MSSSSRRSPVLVLAASLFALCASAPAALGVEAGIRTSAFKLRDDDSPPIRSDRVKISFKSARQQGAPSGVVEAAFGSDGDPTPAGASGGGAELTIHRVDGSPDDVVVIELPAERWLRAGTAAAPGYLYKDSKREGGPITKVQVKKGKLTIQGKGEGLYSLHGAPQGTMVLRLRLGMGVTWCAQAEARDPARSDTTARFDAAISPAPVACATVPEPRPARFLPRLPAGEHLGTKSFSPIAPETVPLLEARMDEALEAGMDVSRIHLNWAEVEPDAGLYTLDELHDDLEEASSRGLRPMLTLGFTDVAEYSIPADLMDPEDTTKLAPGVRLDDPAVIARYQALLDLILPDLLSHGVWLLSLANEPNALLDELPFSRRADEEEAMVRFVRAVRDYVHAFEPELAVTVSLAQGGFVDPPVGLVLASDVATFNYGCLDTSRFVLRSTSTTPREVSRMLASARGRPVVIQELSCLAGYEDQPSVLGASLDYQRSWFEAFYGELAERERLRAAFILDTVDWPEWLAEFYSDFLRDEGLPEIADQWEEFMRTWGLLHFSDASPKPAWASFLAEIARERAEHP